MTKFIIHANRVDWQVAYLPRFTAGLALLGHQVYHTQDDEADASGINIIFANNSWKLTHQQCLNKKIPLITVGRCLFGCRHDMVALGWDGFNGAADFCLDDKMPDDRWQKHGFCIPGIRGGDASGFVLVCGEFRDVGAWYEQLRSDLNGQDVRFRSHPFKRDKIEAWPDAPQAGQDAIDEVLAGAKACVTYDSIAGCDAVFNGVPSITYGENAMARPVSFNSWDHFWKFQKTGIPEETEGKMSQSQWANRLAYCQWSHAEIETGEWWGHLERGLAKRLS